jgi:hypothetical protein
MKNLWYPFKYICIYRKRERENCLSSGYNSRNLDASFGFANQTWFWFASYQSKFIDAFMGWASHITNFSRALGLGFRNFKDLEMIA